MAEDNVKYIIIQAEKAKSQTEQAMREAKEAVAEHQKELLRGAPLEILKQKKVAAQLAKEQAAALADAQKKAEEAAAHAAANAKKKAEDAAKSVKKTTKKTTKKITKAFSTKKKHKHKK